jgi:broad specificity phosphatase PhoE
LLLVRHSAPEIDVSVPAEEWRLSEEGRRLCGPITEELAALAPSVLVSSPEPKSRETAELIAPSLGLDVRVVDGLRETARRTVSWLAPADFERGVRALFERPDEIVFGEESAAGALARFEMAVADLPDSAVVVSHGTVISLYVAAQTGLDAFYVWRSLGLPELVQI